MPVDFAEVISREVRGYLASLGARDEELRRAESLLGGLTDAEADQLESSVHRLREHWR